MMCGSATRAAAWCPAPNCAAGGATCMTWCITLALRGCRQIRASQVRTSCTWGHCPGEGTAANLGPSLTRGRACAGGDEWLERKGRRSVPGPEQRRGRKGLFETFQMSSNPFTDGRTLDDIFLERKGRRALQGPSEGADMYTILQDQQIDVAPAPREVARYYVSELVPVDGSLTTRTVPSLTKRVAA